MNISMDDYKEFRGLILKRNYREQREEKEKGVITYAISDNTGKVMLSREVDYNKDRMSFHSFISLEDARTLPLKSN